ncbi:hypothetical protein [Nocardioides terrisoli]|uniref:hypothetical protein n=1 Tax=Nocardioides terrisoli TaxID=3388267 RepID=UPI00287B7DC8|nr:hypothetical protein [Nocardioides marmorisolisilvae]
MLGAAALLAVTPLVAACGASGQAGTVAADPGAVHTMPDGTLMKDSTMRAATGAPTATPGATAGASSAARMTCSDDTAASVQRTLALATPPARTSHWTSDGADGTYRCTYRVPGGTLRLVVRDLDRAVPGRAWFDQLRARLPGTRPIRGLQSFGFPAFETGSGDVAFLKDHKALWVDAHGVPRADLPPGISRTGAAYGVAAAVIACWAG